MAGDVVGTQLRAARDRVGLSIQDVSDRLKLTVRMVEAIEAHDRRWLPANVYLRGYVRRYAKLLGLDPEPLVAAYGVETSVPADDSVVWWDGAASAARSLPVMIAGGGLVAAVVVLLLVWLWPRNDNAAAPVADLSPPIGRIGIRNCRSFLRRGGCGFVRADRFFGCRLGRRLWRTDELAGKRRRDAYS